MSGLGVARSATRQLLVVAVLAVTYIVGAWSARVSAEVVQSMRRRSALYQCVVHVDRHSVEVTGRHPRNPV